MGRISINNMRFYTYNGALDEERVLGQTLEIDLTLSLSLEKAANSDNLEDTINYSEVYEVIKKFVQGHSYKLIESLANGIIERLFIQYLEVVKKIEIRVRKYHVPIDGILDNIEIEMEREVQCMRI
ncbi:dihydroneopterin aldolase [Enterococcus avium]